MLVSSLKSFFYIRLHDKSLFLISDWSFEYVTVSLACPYFEWILPEVFCFQFSFEDFL